VIFEKLDLDSIQSVNGFVERPWGKYIELVTIYDKGDMVHKQKLLVVKSNAHLQLHKHIGYAELWIGESSFTYVIEDDRGQLLTKLAQPFERIFIPKNRKHRIINGTEELRIFEAQTGIILETDNIKFD
jgi:oxalate decarboxylase/phosphoglucose isomerase-like protein (cupin superfamily)